MRAHIGFRSVAVLVLGLLIAAGSVLADEAPPARKKIDPKPLASQTQKGLDYLVNQQHEDGGWGQGGGWRTSKEGRVEGKEVADPADLGNTCIAALVLIRSGSTPDNGPYARQLARAMDFICQHVEQADSESLWVTDVRDTQLQSKIGSYVDTFLTGLVLSELKGKIADGPLAKRSTTALEKTIAKIERNQQKDGTFAGNNGWASVLSQSLCSKALNRAFQSGVAVKEGTLDKDFQIAVAATQPAATDVAVSGPMPASVSGTTEVAAAPADLSGVRLSAGYAGGTTVSAGRIASIGSAGIDLYALSAGNAVAAENINSNASKVAEARKVLEDEKATDEEKQVAQFSIQRADEMAKNQATAVDAIVKRLDDKQFVAGFGNNGGEEFLSYMNISEALLVKGGEQWEKWDRDVATNLHRVQNSDGSWSGHHCITGRTFCTGTALLALMADRAPLPEGTEEASE